MKHKIPTVQTGKIEFNTVTEDKAMRGGKVSQLSMFIQLCQWTWEIESDRGVREHLTKFHLELYRCTQLAKEWATKSVTS